MERKPADPAIRDPSQYHYLEMPDERFPLDVFKRVKPLKGQIFGEHWHEHLQFFFFTKGQALIRCSGKEHHVRRGDTLVINSNELHYGENTGGPLEFWLIRIDLDLLRSFKPDPCQTKYILPLVHNRILFKNRIAGDPAFASCLRTIIAEHAAKKNGFELMLKGEVCRAVALLLRRHVRSIESAEETARRLHLTNRFNDLLSYLETHYREKTDLDRMAEISNLSKHHFCRLFKQLTGCSPGDYLNRIRISKATELLRESAMNVTEIALASGFDDISYFSRCFRKYTNSTPTGIRDGKCPGQDGKIPAGHSGRKAVKMAPE